MGHSWTRVEDFWTSDEEREDDEDTRKERPQIRSDYLSSGIGKEKEDKGR